MSMTPRRALILGVAGHDFHDFNTVHQDQPTPCDLVIPATTIDITRVLKVSKPVADVLQIPRYGIWPRPPAFPLQNAINGLAQMTSCAMIDQIHGKTLLNY